jgi:hypothetical protein
MTANFIYGLCICITYIYVLFFNFCRQRLHNFILLNILILKVVFTPFFLKICVNTFFCNMSVYTTNQNQSAGRRVCVHSWVLYEQGDTVARDVLTSVMCFKPM